jgi:hypothetical protein
MQAVKNKRLLMANILNVVFGIDDSLLCDIWR